MCNRPPFLPAARRAAVFVQVVLLIGIASTGAALFAPAKADDAPGDLVTITGTFAQEQYVSGAEVMLNAVEGSDFFVSGGNVEFDHIEVQDIAVAGGSVRFGETKADKVQAVGGELEFDRLTANKLVAAGGRIKLRDGGVIEGYATVAGAEIDLAGHIGGNLKAAGARVRLSGVIDGDARIAASRVIVGPNARIGGDFTYVSGDEAQIAPGAQILGKIERNDAPESEMPVGVIIGVIVLIWLVAVVALSVLVIVLQLALPGLLDAAARTIKTRPWPSLGLGFALLIATPIAASLIASSIVGIPLAAVVYASAVPVVAVGYTSIVYWLGCSEVRRSLDANVSRKRRLLGAVLGVLLLAIAVLVPLIGWLAVLLAVAMGTGAVALAAWNLWTARSERVLEPSAVAPSS